jgi:hypothetical protein
VVESLTSASRVLIVPGYGLAVANAQHSIAELTKKLKTKGVQVRGSDACSSSTEDHGFACDAAVQFCRLRTRACTPLIMITQVWIVLSGVAPRHAP